MVGLTNSIAVVGCIKLGYEYDAGATAARDVGQSGYVRVPSRCGHSSLQSCKACFTLRKHSYEHNKFAVVSVNHHQLQGTSFS